KMTRQSGNLGQLFHEGPCQRTQGQIGPGGAAFAKGQQLVSDAVSLGAVIALDISGFLHRLEEVERRTVGHLVDAADLLHAEPDGTLIQAVENRERALDSGNL